MWSTTKRIFAVAGSAMLCFACTNQTNPESTVEPEKKQQVRFVYEDHFSPEEKLKLEEWINFTSEAAQEVLGEFPFDLSYHFHREDSAGVAVVFGHTARTDSTHAAHFYVDPTYSMDDLKADWIAPHEISHLAIPRLPKRHLWFYEGFATYMSRQVMIKTGIYTPAEVDSINHARIVNVKSSFETSSQLQVVTDSLIENHNWASVYWIGASFFVQADKQLRSAGKGPLVDVLKEFQVCCHKTGLTIDELIASFDTISESTLFSELYAHYTTAPCSELLRDY